MHASELTKNFSLRRALSLSITVVFAFIFNHYFSFSHEYWIPYAALLVSQTSTGTPIKQGVIISIIMFIAILCATFIEVATLISAIVLSVLFIIVGCLTFNFKRLNTKSFFFLCFFMTLLVAILFPTNTSFLMRFRIYDMFIGSGLGIILHIILFPIKLDKAFGAGITPVLISLKSYMEVLTLSLTSSNEVNARDRARIAVEKNLQQTRYPEWAYEVGFNRGLRSGFRFFLINLERIIELVFSMDYLNSQKINPILVEDMRDDLTLTMQKNKELLDILIHYFQSHELQDTQSDFTSDMVQLEKTFNRVVPNNIELLDVSPSNIVMTAFVRDIRDMRGLLLQLVMALPTRRKT